MVEKLERNDMKRKTQNRKMQLRFRDAKSRNFKYCVLRLLDAKSIKIENASLKLKVGKSPILRETHATYIYKYIKFLRLVPRLGQGCVWVGSKLPATPHTFLTQSEKLKDSKSKIMEVI